MIAGFFSVVLGVVLILLAIVNVVRAFGLRAFGSSIWIAVLATAVLVGIGGVLIVVNPWGASMTFVLVLGATVHRQRRGGSVHRVVHPRF